MYLKIILQISFLNKNLLIYFDNLWPILVKYDPVCSYETHAVNHRHIVLPLTLEGHLLLFLFLFLPYTKTNTLNFPPDIGWQKQNYFPWLYFISFSVVM